MFVSLQINLYICNVASCMRQDIIRKRFGYSTMVNLDNSLSNRNNGNAPLGYNICFSNIYCLRCERLFLFVARQSRAYHWNELK